MPTYLPEGYKNIQLEITGNSYFAVYENNNGDNIFLYSLSKDSVAGVDSENAYTEIKCKEMPPSVVIYNRRTRKEAFQMLKKFPV